MSKTHRKKTLPLTRGQLALTGILVLLALAAVFLLTTPPEPMAQRVMSDVDSEASADTGATMGIYYGQFEYRNPDNEVSHLVLQESPSELMCSTQIENYRDGVEISCPGCTMGEPQCSRELPADLQGIFEDAAMPFPYLSAAAVRIAVLDARMSRAVFHCREMAEVWSEGMGEEARCVTP